MISSGGLASRIKNYYHYYLNVNLKLWEKA